VYPLQVKVVRILAPFFLVLVLLSVALLSVTAYAVPITAGSSQRQSNTSGYEDNPVPAGKSPTTGLPWTGEYKPILVQISNTAEARPHWNLSEADIVYEAVNAAPYHTRYTAIYNDNYPDFVGAVRSARVHHVSLTKEWDAPLVFWGGQGSRDGKSYVGTNIWTAFKDLSIPEAYRFDGTAGGKDFSPALTRAPSKYNRVNPHNAVADLAWLVANVYPADHTPRNHAFQFTTTPSAGFDSAVAVDINYGGDYHPSYSYNEVDRVYERSYNDQPEVDGITNKRIVAANVIVQRAKLSFFNNSAERPVITMTGEGEAEFFIGGHHIRGKWLRKSDSDRTVFVDLMGVEVQLLPGKTFIQVIPNTLDFTYTRADGGVITSKVDQSKLTDVELYDISGMDTTNVDEMGDTLDVQPKP
jgi:hypothetical protein